MKHKKFGFSEMVLRHFNNDISKCWYWEWWEKGKRKRAAKNINDFKTSEERLNAANDLRRQLETSLKKPPKPTTSVIYQHLIPYLTKHCELLRSASSKYYSTCLTTFDEWLCNNGYKGY